VEGSGSQLIYGIPTCLKGLKKTTKNRSYGSLSLADLNPGSPQYKAQVLTTWVGYLLVTDVNMVPCYQCAKALKHVGKEWETV
jgi:hypothetical protein